MAWIHVFRRVSSAKSRGRCDVEVEESSLSAPRTSITEVPCFEATLTAIMNNCSGSIDTPLDKAKQLWRKENSINSNIWHGESDSISMTLGVACSSSGLLELLVSIDFASRSRVAYGFELQSNLDGFSQLPRCLDLPVRLITASLIDQDRDHECTVRGVLEIRMISFSRKGSTEFFIWPTTLTAVVIVFVHSLVTNLFCLFAQSNFSSRSTLAQLWYNASTNMRIHICNLISRYIRMQQRIRGCVEQQHHYGISSGRP